MAKFAVIILNWNGLSLTQQCLVSIQAAKLQPAKIVVLDNGSNVNELAALQQQFGSYIAGQRSESNLGFTGGNNLVMQQLLSEGGYDYFILLNQDAVVDEYCFTHLIDYLENHPRAAVAGPLVVNADRRTIQSCGARINWYTGKVVSQLQGQPLGNQPKAAAVVDIAIGNCWAVRTTALQDIGLFDDRYFAYYEEVDWQVKAKRRSWQSVIVPQAIAYHSKAGGFRTFWNVRNMIWFMRRYATIPQLTIFFCYFWTIFFIERRRKGSPTKEFLRAAWEGWWV